MPFTPKDIEMIHTQQPFQLLPHPEAGSGPQRSSQPHWPNPWPDDGHLLLPAGPFPYNPPAASEAAAELAWTLLQSAPAKMETKQF